MIVTRVYWLLLAALGCRASSHADTPDPTASQQDSIIAAATRDSLAFVRWNLPRLAAAALSHTGYAERYDLFLGLNPYYQRGHLDTDTVLDVAVQVVEKTTSKRGVMIVHGGDSVISVLGAGTGFGNGGDDFRWLWVWRIESRDFRPDLNPRRREVLFVEKPESAGGVIWWNGTEYVWTQHGD